MIDMLVAVFVLALCGIAGGYLLGRSALTFRYRDRHERRRDVYGCALDGLLEDMEIPYGVIAADNDILPSDQIPDGLPEGKQRFQLLRKWAWSYMVTCGICSGWHVAYLSLVVWAAGAAVFGADQPLEGQQVFPAWLAACGLHTLVSSWANKREIW